MRTDGQGETRKPNSRRLRNHVTGWPANLNSPIRSLCCSLLQTCRPPIPTMASTGSPRTNSFFDTASTPTVSPATRYAAPSPLNLSRASSIRAPDRKASDEPLSPLHQSPITPSSSSWQPPLPPSEAIELRFNSDEAQLLGEGRYAQVYLAHFRRSNKGKERALDVEEGWTLCAAKQMNQDRESQTMGLREAFFLNRLKSPK